MLAMAGLGGAELLQRWTRGGCQDDALEADIELSQGAFRLEARITAPGDGITVLFGPSGSGKSTLLSVLAGLQARGSAARSGWAARALDACRRTGAGIGLVFQDARLFPHLSVRQNIAYAWKRAPGQKRPGIEEVAQFFDIAALAGSAGDKSFGRREKPRGAGPGRGRRARISCCWTSLSRRWMARAAAPSSQVLSDMHRNYRLPMMVVTHNIDDAAALATHLVALNNGRVAVQGTFTDASRAPEFQALLDSADIGTAMPASSLRSSHGGRSLWLRADQVLLAAEEPRAVSARNVLAGEVSAVIAESERGRLVELATPQGVVLSRVTPEAVDDLGLAPGKKAWALVKAHAL